MESPGISLGVEITLRLSAQHCQFLLKICPQPSHLSNPLQGINCNKARTCIISVACRFLPMARQQAWEIMTQRNRLPRPLTGLPSTKGVRLRRQTSRSRNTQTRLMTFKASKAASVLEKAIDHPPRTSSCLTLLHWGFMQLRLTETPGWPWKEAPERF